MNRLTFYLDITAASGSTITAGPVQHTLGKGACGRRTHKRTWGKGQMTIARLVPKHLYCSQGKKWGGAQ